ncbi:hypothetical protein [Modestobacter sp. SSW1-42]|uniref:hypothetical protein n=1 Tax=Modestobacter sp. SSW1-42 TaxID=596372 RepID=UPI0039882C21
MVLESPDGAVLSCWDTAEEAGAAVAATRGDGRWPEARAYRVVDVFTGAAAGEQPRQAQLTWFGPTDRHRADARDRAGRERLWPAVARVPGVVWAVALRGDDGSSVVVGLGADDGTAEAVQAAVMGTVLLPWEDPADLTGPDRVEVHRVRSAQLPAWTTAGVSR